MSLRRNLLVLALSAGLPACNPYKNFNGDYYLGPVDPGCPANVPSGPGTACNPFPADYVGVGFTPAQTAGVVMPNAATASTGATVLYYPFHVSAGFDPNLAAAFGVAPSNPLRLRTQTVDASGNPVDRDRQKAYVFDIAPGGDDGKTDTNKCKPPSADYVYDQRTDAFPFNRQLNVFQQKQTSADPASLPSDQPSYMPIYAEVPVTSGSYDCESIHSADGVIDGLTQGKTTLAVNPAPKGSPDFRQVGKHDDHYLALAIIDPSADVITVPDPALGATGVGACPAALDDAFGSCHNPITHLGPQRWGFFDHFLVAYIDGGYVPTKMTTVTGTPPAADQTITSAQAMIMYAPDAYNDPFNGPSTCNELKNNPASCIGHGFDLIQGIGENPAGTPPVIKPGIRDAANNGYSPICHVLTYDPNVNPVGVASNPKDVDMNALDPDTGAFVYCLQIAK